MTETQDIVAALKKRADMIVAAHEAKSGKKIERPFTLDDLAIAEIERLQTELEKARARGLMLQEKLWTVLKDRRDESSFEALTANQNLEWAISAGLNSHLPTLEEVQAAGPYVRVGLDETLEEAIARAAASPVPQNGEG